MQRTLGGRHIFENTKEKEQVIIRGIVGLDEVNKGNKQW